MNKKTTYGSKFPDLELLDNSEQRAKYEEEIAELSEQEQKKFNYISPTQHNDFSQRRMYWSSTMEQVGRGFIIFAQILAVTLAYFIGQKVILIAVGSFVNPNLEITKGIYVRDFLAYGFLIITVLFGLLYFIPMAICRTAGAVYGWAIAYIMLAILYFLFLEIICAVLLVLSSIKVSSNDSGDINTWIPVFMIVVLVITSIWIVGACILLVKSDDVKRKISLEV